MGVMSREIKKLRGRKSYRKVQEQLDTLSEAQVSRKVQDMNQTYLRELYYGLETIMERMRYHEDLLRDIAANLEIREPSELDKALELIKEYTEDSGRIAWRKIDDPKELVFAYMCKAENEGINIESTVEMQRVPEYRRAFQYVAYNIGSWRKIVEEYRKR